MILWGTILLDFWYTSSEDIVRKVFSDTEVFISIPYHVEKSQYCPTLADTTESQMLWILQLFGSYRFKGDGDAAEKLTEGKATLGR